MQMAQSGGVNALEDTSDERELAIEARRSRMSVHIQLLTRIDGQHVGAPGSRGSDRTQDGRVARVGRERRPESRGRPYLRRAGAAAGADGAALASSM